MGLVVETAPTSFIKRYASTARGYGAYGSNAARSGSVTTTACMSRSITTSSTRGSREVWPEVRSFIRTGRFSAAANRTPPGSGATGGPDHQGARGAAAMTSLSTASASRRTWPPEMPGGRGARGASGRRRHATECRVPGRRRIRPASRRRRSSLSAAYVHDVRARPADRCGRRHPVAAAVQSARRHAGGRETGSRAGPGEIFNDLPDRIADVMILAGAGYAARELRMQLRFWDGRLLPRRCSPRTCGCSAGRSG